MPRQALLEHLLEHALRTDGPFTLRSGQVSSWYLDARQTTFDGAGAKLVGSTIVEVLESSVVAVGGMTMGADPIAVATAIAASGGGRPLRAFSVRKEAKDHGTGGRVVGPVSAGDRVAVLEDTTTTGSAAWEATQALSSEGLEVVQVVTLVDRSGGVAGERFEAVGVPFVSVFGVADLGVEE